MSGPALPQAGVDDGIDPDAWTPLNEVLSAYSIASRVRTADDHVPFAMGERRFLGKVAFLCSDDRMRLTVADELGIDLPIEPNTATSQGNVTAMWLSPNEWMLSTPQGGERPLIASLQQALAGGHALCLDVSDRWTVIAVAGAKAPEVLAKGTSVPLRPPAFGVGRCCQTSLFSTPVIIRRTGREPVFDIFVDATLAEYLWLWLEHAADGFDTQLLDTTC